MTNERTGKRVASIAGKYAGMSYNQFVDRLHHTFDGYETVFADVVSMACSLINQAPNKTFPGDRHPPPLRPFNKDHDGSEVGEFPTYVKPRSRKRPKNTTVKKS